MIEFQPFEVVCIDAWIEKPGRDPKSHPKFMKHYTVIDEAKKEGETYYFLQGFPGSMVFNSKGFRNA